MLNTYTQSFSWNCNLEIIWCICLSLNCANSSYKTILFSSNTYGTCSKLFLTIWMLLVTRWCKERWPFHYKAAVRTWEVELTCKLKLRGAHKMIRSTLILSDITGCQVFLWEIGWLITLLVLKLSTTFLLQIRWCSRLRRWLCCPLLCPGQEEYVVNSFSPT